MKRSHSSRRARGLGLVSVAVVAACIAALVQPAAAVPPSADLSIVLSHTPAGALTGQNITFTMTVTNAGPDAASNVVVALPLTYELEVRSAVASTGSCQHQVEAPLVICGTASLAAGQSMTSTVVIRSMAGGVAHLEAAVDSDTPDPDRSNGTGEDTLIVQLGPPFAEQLAKAYFSDILGRAPTAAELDALERRINAARFGHLTEVAFGLLSTPEYRTIRITGAYLAILGRHAGAAETNYWLGYIARGGSFERMAVQMVGSSEFLRKAGGRAGFVNAAYRAILGRSADQGALGYWNRRLAAGMTTGQVASALQFSLEGLNRIIDQRFQAVFGHGPTQGARFYWLLGLRQGVSVERLFATLFASGEYLRQFVEPYCCLGGGGGGYRPFPGAAAAAAHSALAQRSRSGS